MKKYKIWAVGMTLGVMTSLSAGAASPGEAAAAVNPASDVCSVFVNLPANVLEILPKETRLDMVTYIEADSIWKAPNVMGGVSELVKVVPGFLEVRISSVSTMQIKKLPYKGGELYMTVYTVGNENQAPDSDVRFFTPSLQELPRERFFKLPEFKDFVEIPKSSAMTLKELDGIVPFPTYEFSASPEADTLIGVLTVGTYLTTEDKDRLEPYVKKSGVSYVWNGKKFELDQQYGKKS